MKLNPLIAGALISAVLALEAWTLKGIVEVKVAIAELTVRVDDLQQNKHHEHSSLALHP